MDSAIDRRSVLSESEFQRAMREALAIEDGQKRAAVIFLALTGCRVGEVLLVKHSDIRWLDGAYSEVEIPTLKRVGRPKRRVHIPNAGEPTRALFTYWDALKRSKGPLFTLSKRTLQLTVEEILKRVKPSRKGLAHIFRHTHASRLIAAGADWAYVRQQLGWSNLETAKRYVHTPEERVAEIASKMSV